jgi:DNA modification methylase
MGDVIMAGSPARAKPSVAVRRIKHPRTVARDPAEVDPRNSLNELTGGEWLYFTKSVMTTAYPPELGHELRKAHGACKPPSLMKELIQFFTKSGGVVLDPFAGVGGTLLGASISEPARTCIGIEINQAWVDIYLRVCGEEGIAPQEVIVDDCRAAMRRLEPESVAFVATDPPYNIHLERTMCNGVYDATHSNRRTDYDMRSDNVLDLANVPSFDAYLDGMREVFTEMNRVLIPGGYVAVIVRNAYQNGRYIYTNVHLAEAAEAAGFVLKGEKVWYQAGTRLRPYGYPFAYVPNIAHQYIVVLQKPR